MYMLISLNNPPTPTAIHHTNPKPLTLVLLYTIYSYIYIYTRLFDRLMRLICVSGRLRNVLPYIPTPSPTFRPSSSLKTHSIHSPLSLTNVWPFCILHQTTSHSYNNHTTLTLTNTDTQHKHTHIFSAVIRRNAYHPPTQKKEGYTVSTTSKWTSWYFQCSIIFNWFKFNDWLLFVFL